MLQVLLVRHGRTEANANGTLQGHLPTRLDDLGHAQAALVARRLARGTPKVDALVSSDLVRARETARYIAEACALSLSLDPAWRERSFGPLEGAPLGELAVWRAADASEPPGAEPIEAFRARVRAALTALLARRGGEGAVCVVTHGGALRAILRSLSEGGLPRAPGEPPPSVISLSNCSLTHLVNEGEGWRVRAVNDTAHLAVATDADAG